MLGYDTQERLFRKKPQRFTLSEIMNEILFNDYLSHYEYHIEDSLEDDAYMQQHFDFITKSEKTQVYYNINLLKNNQPKMLFKRLFIDCFGVCNYRRLGKWVHQTHGMVAHRKSEEKRNNE